MEYIKEVVVWQSNFKKVLDEFDDCILIEKEGDLDYVNINFIDNLGFLS
jgi:hypothetical protein